jgi:hypothetical protein
MNGGHRALDGWRMLASRAPYRPLPLDIDADAPSGDAQVMDTCAWCNLPVDSPTEIHGVPYHWTCLPLRMAALRIAKDPFHDDAPSK